MNKRWLSLSIAVGLVFLLAVPGCTDFQTGVDAYNRGDYETALKKFLPLANQGDAAAQYFLGGMYAQGTGVPQDYTEAMKWHRVAADQGDANAQYNLGIMYDKGRGCRRIIFNRICGPLSLLPKVMRMLSKGLKYWGRKCPPTK